MVALESISDPVSIYEPVYSESGDALYVLDQISDRDTMESWLGELSCAAPSASWENGSRTSCTSAFSGAHPDRGCKGDRHFTGTGLPAGENAILQVRSAAGVEKS